MKSLFGALVLVLLCSCSGDAETSTPSSADTGTMGSGVIVPGPPAEQPCQPLEHPWVKELSGGVGEVLVVTNSAELSAVLDGLAADKRYAVILDGENFEAIRLPSGRDLRLIGRCQATVIEGEVSGGDGARIGLTGFHLVAGVQLESPETAHSDQNSFKNTAGSAWQQRGGSLRFTHNQIQAVSGRGLSLDSLQSVIVGDNHFLGPLGGEGVFIVAQEGAVEITANRFEDVSGDGLHVIQSKPSAQSIIVGDNHFLGPLGGEGVFSSSNASAFHAFGNRFEQIQGSGMSLIDHTASVIVGDNHFLGPLGGEGVFIWNSGGVEASALARNAVDNTASFGVLLAGLEGAWTVQSNVISASGERGVLVQDLGVNSTLTVTNNTIEGAIGSALEIIGSQGAIEIAHNQITKVITPEIGGSGAPATGLGIVALDTDDLRIYGNRVTQTALAGIVIDLADRPRLSANTRLEVGFNDFDGLAKYDVVIQNIDDVVPQGAEISTRSGSAIGFGQRFALERRRGSPKNCGDGQTQAGETCDDGNRIDSDGCTNQCQVAQCGDGIRRTGLASDDPNFEACDLGADNGLCAQCALQYPKGLSVGLEHACARTGDSVWCWGANGSGQVTGNATRTNFPNPQTPVHIETRPDELVGGLKHSCVLTNATTQCHGDTANGRLLGNSYSSPNENHWDITPGGIFAGANVSCLIKDEQLFCAGALDHRAFYSSQLMQLAQGHQIRRAVASLTHLCIETAAGTSCMGDNSAAALSDDPDDANQLVSIDDDVSRRLAVGANLTCQVLENESVRCRGHAGYGRLGRGGSGRCVQNCGRSWDEVRNLEEIADVSIGEFHACALDRAGRVYCWGKNQYRAVGVGAQTLVSEPSEQVPLPLPAMQVGTGRHFSCAQLIDERVFCWGKNNAGQLGRGMVGDASNPAAVHIP